MENIRLAFQGIWSHKMRSILTMLGIIIGIAAIITIVSTIQGTNEQIKENLIGSGSNVVTVQLYQDNYPYDLSYNPLPQGVKTMDPSIRKELEELDGVEQVAFFNHRQWSDNIMVGTTTFSGGAYGIDEYYLSLMDLQIAYGRSFTREDQEQFRRVMILDKTAAASLFPGEYPIGKTVEIKVEPFTVVGVVEKGNSFNPVINNMNDYYMYTDTSGGKVFIPMATWPAVYRFDEPQSVVVRARSTDAMTVAGKNVADYLTAALIPGREISSDVPAEDTEDTVVEEPVATGSFSYRSEDLLEQARQLQEMSNASNRQLIWIASISLVVGGIGVMNIMLVSVTERTSEIGLKKALGAKKRRIRIQFLTEAAVLTSLGGVVGILVGIVLAQLISTTNGIPVAISVPAIVISVVFSMLIGIVFGLLPAMKAANLNPIVALRRD